MNAIIYLVGLIVIVIVFLSCLGFQQLGKSDEKYIHNVVRFIRN